MPSVCKMIPEQASSLQAAIKQEYDATTSNDYPAPHGCGIGYFWDKVQKNGYATVAQKGHSQYFENTAMVFFSDYDGLHSFNPMHIQTRYNELVIEAKLNNMIELSDLEWLYSQACDERRDASWDYRARLE